MRFTGFYSAKSRNTRNLSLIHISSTGGMDIPPLVLNKYFHIPVSASMLAVSYTHLLILPGKPDKWFVYALAKTHYKALISSGVKISEWQPGFTHAKICLLYTSRCV